MPITQERMLALIYAASDFQQGYKTLAELIVQQRKYIQTLMVNGTFKPKDALDALDLLAEQGSLRIPLVKPFDSEMTILQEAKHYSDSRRRENEKRKNALATKRRAFRNFNFVVCISKSNE